METRTVVATIRLLVPVGEANLASIVGPALGQRGVNLRDFMLKFNAATSHLKEKLKVRVLVVVFDDKSYTLTIGLPLVSYYIKRITELTKKDIISLTQVYELASALSNGSASFNYFSMPALCSMIISTARSMRIVVIR